jgi:cytochrome b subunit of formate dehydrogenase
MNARRILDISMIAVAILVVECWSLVFVPAASAAEDEDCMICHSDPGLVSEADRLGRSLFVEERILLGTPHEENGCVSCHYDADVEEFPHDSLLAPPDCGICHDAENEQYLNSLHGQAFERKDPFAPTCADCHGKHRILPPSNPESRTYIMNIPATCGQCHREDSEMVRRHDISQQDIIRHYSMSIHGEGLFEKGLTVTAVCSDCHTPHNILPHTDPRSSIHRENIASTCMQCHAQIEKVHLKVIRGELWEERPHMIPACVDCHSPHKIRRVFYEEEFTDDYCMRCHRNPELTRVTDEGKLDTLHVQTAELERGVPDHDIACIKCHTDIDRRKHPVCEDSGPVDCSMCHAEISELYGKGIHGKLAAKGDENAPHCTECHGEHEILSQSDLESPTFPRNIPGLCARCHREGEDAAVRYLGKETEVISHYTMSIHGKGLMESGLMVSAVCSDCHMPHIILPTDDPESSVNPTNVGRTCAQCHLGIYEDFRSSIHSPVVSDTEEKLPTCNYCHSSHQIARVDRDDFRNEMLVQCGGCHKYLTETYFDTYHGKASQLGSVRAAKCQDCHGSHSILPSSNPSSTLSRQNVIETCKACHPSSNRKFTGYLSHATHHNRHTYPLLYYTFWSLSFLIIGVFAFFGIHTLLWIPRSIRERFRLRSVVKEPVTKYIVRFRTFPRVLHLMVIVSFLGLALTGMSIKFAGFGWALTISRVFGGIEFARIIHRFCALITFAYFGLHFVYIFQNARREGRNIWRYMFGREGMMPNKKDFVDFFQTILWFFGRKKAPKYGRWTYWEKFDYFAVFWGVAVIGSTGLVLWFPEFFTKFIPGYLINVATIVHSDEALLATGFIFTIHFFNTHFRPQKFPMDQVIFTGKVPFEEFKLERPQEYEMLVAKGKLEEHLTTEPPPRKLVILSRVFGWTSLLIGFGLVILIVWAMVFQYG